jgi:hypothetical protein
MNKKKTCNTITILAMLLIFIVITAENAFAYLDPGTGSFVLQMLIAGVLGGLFVIKTYWRKIKIFMNKIFNKEK